MPPTSSDYVEPRPSLSDLMKQVKHDPIFPWKTEVTEETVKFCLSDDLHSLPKYIVVVDASLEFIIYAFNWPLHDYHNISMAYKHCIKNGEQVKNSLLTIENSMICEGLIEDDDLKSVAIDPNSDMDEPIPRTVIRHSIPHIPSPTQFKATVYYRSAACDIIVDKSKPCDPCKTIEKQLRKVAKKRAKASSAKSNAPLAACGPGKLRATVVATRLKCKQLEERLEELQERITEQGISIDKSLEDDILKIMDGQNLETTPHMKFFWQELIKLLQSSGSGWRYHPQIIRFALSLHGKSPVGIT